MEKEIVQAKIIALRDSLYPLIPGLKEEDLLSLDLGTSSPYLQNIDLKNTEQFSQLLFQDVLKGRVGIGGFFEDRIIYRRSTHYDGEEARSLHLGLDIWMPAGCALYNPLAGKVYSLQDNQGFGNYGPTLILEHHLNDVHFFSLYGHLDPKVLDMWQAGDPVAAGQHLADIGNYPENGDWPPHLHWQLMTDMLGNVGDFPGVARPSDRNFYLHLCIDPHYLLVFDR